MPASQILTYNRTTAGWCSCAASSQIQGIKSWMTRPTGLYLDRQVTLDVPYYYRLMAVDKKGRRSAVLGPVEAVPSSDPFPPRGWLLINDGAVSTSSRTVLLSLNASPDPIGLRGANGPTFASASWVPYVKEKGVAATGAAEAWNRDCCLYPVPGWSWQWIGDGLR